MSDATIERREECKIRHNRIDSLYNWFKGNGNLGAGERLINIENIVNGNKECNTMKELKKHIHEHEVISGRRWEVIIGILLLLAGQVFSIYLMSKGG